MDGDESASIIHDSFVCCNKVNTRKISTNQFSSMTGSFMTLYGDKVKIKLSELNFIAHIFAPFHVISKKSNDDEIFDQLGINLHFQNNFISLNKYYRY